MDIEQVLRAQLTAITDKIYPLEAPEGIKAPYIIYHMTRGSRLKSLDGYNGSRYTTFQFDITAPSYGQIKVLMKQLAEVLMGIQGFTSADGLNIQNCDLLNEFETFESITKSYRGIVECRIFYIV